jgi:hypothetical protein
MIEREEIERLACAAFGEPNEELSNETELRFSTHGSKSVNRETGAYYDFEVEEGGHIRDFPPKPNGDARGTKANGEDHNSKKSRRRTASFKIVKIWSYVDEAGDELFQVCRMEKERLGGMTSRSKPTASGTRSMAGMNGTSRAFGRPLSPARASRSCRAGQDRFPCRRLKMCRCGLRGRWRGNNQRRRREEFSR